MRTIAIAGLLLAAVGCDRDESKGTEARNADDVKVRVESARPAADNTERNERDRDRGALTATDQGESEADREITQQIRQAVMKQDGLSMNAKNAKIITKDGVVTLRGPVESAAEKTTLGTLARSAAGAQRVDNQLEVAAP